MVFEEIVGSFNPWEIADEEPEQIIEVLRKRALVNSVYVITPMHHSKRPLTDHFFPHHPVRKVYFPEDSRVYHTVHPEYYRGTKIKPVPTARENLKDVDWVDVLTSAARKQGLKTGVEVSHSVVPWAHSREQFPDCAQRDVYGNAFVKQNINLCPNNPDVRIYLAGLFSDLVASHDVDMVQTCYLFFHPGQTGFPRPFPAGADGLLRLLAVSTGGCFCDACERRAGEAGLDWVAMKAAVKEIADALNTYSPEAFHKRNLLAAGNLSNEELLLELPEFYQWLRFRCDSVTEVFADIHRAIKDQKPEVDFRYNGSADAQHMRMGVDFRTAHRYMDSVREGDYSEQSGDAAMLAVKRAKHLNLRRIVGDQKKVIAAIGIRPKATREIVKQGVITAAFAGADGLSLGHYDGAPLTFLDAVREGIEEAEVHVV
jgi:hypothetical protein